MEEQKEKQRLYLRGVRGGGGMLSTHFFQNFIFRYDCNCSEMKGLGQSMHSLSIYRAFIRYPVTQAAF